MNEIFFWMRIWGAKVYLLVNLETMQSAEPMKRQWAYFIAIALFLVALAAAWVTLTPDTRPPHDTTVEAADVSASGILDGMTFSGVMGQIGEQDDVKDIFVFANGTFFSAECDKRCGYPARPYFVRQVGDTIEFLSESRCLYKDAKIVWRGTVDGGKIKGVSTWTVNRWYWTIEKEFLFEGTLVESAGPVASG